MGASLCELSFPVEHLKGTEWGSQPVIMRALEHFDENGERKVIDGPAYHFIYSLSHSV
jgi:hypothetical protein